MTSTKGITLYLHVHQPWRVKPYSVFHIAGDHQYFNSDDQNTDNRRIFEKVADKSYRPMNAVLEKLLDEQPDFKLSLSITGTFIEQAQAWAPDVIESFQRLVATGRVEIVGETYEHSLAFFYSRREFEAQVTQHADTIERIFGVRPTAFRNTELAYNDELAQWADGAGYKAILAEGWGPVLGWRSPNYVYQPPQTNNIKLLLKNYQLSDDLAFRFSNREWKEWPLTVDKYSAWLESAFSDNAPLVNLFMDYETFGEHQWEDTGIFTFFKTFVRHWLTKNGGSFYTVSEAADAFEAADVVSSPQTITWADTERDLTAWLGNSMQQEAMKYIYELEDSVLHSGDEELVHDWRKLQTSDHAYYMCTKWFRDGDVHAYFSPYDSPYDAFLYYMNAVRDVRFRVMADKKIGGSHG
jgi:alpha-amylase